MIRSAMPSSLATCTILALVGSLAACAAGSTDLIPPDPTQPPAGDEAGADGGDTTDSGSVDPTDTGSPTDSGSNKDAGKDTGTAMDSGTDTGSGGCGFSGTLVTFDLSQEPGSETSVSPKSSAPGVTVAPLKRSSALSSVSGTGSINASGWTTAGNPDQSHYYTFTITPPAACATTLTTLSVDSSASSTGPSSAAAGTSADNFASPVSFNPGGVSGVSITGASGATGAIEVRIYGYAAGGTGGTLRVRNTLTLSGSLH